MNSEPNSPYKYQLGGSLSLDDPSYVVRQADDELLKTIRDRILGSRGRTVRLLWLYQQILQKGEIAADDSPEQIELLLSGLVVKQSNSLKVYNLIYEKVFDRSWVKRQKDSASYTFRSYV